MHHVGIPENLRPQKSCSILKIHNHLELILEFRTPDCKENNSISLLRPTSILKYIE